MTESQMFRTRADEAMLAAFRANQDIHAATAAAILGLPLNEVTKDQRRHAKSINFGLIYGMSAFGLAKNLGIETKAAAAAERLAAKGRSKSSKALQQDLPAEFEILTEAEDAVALVLRIYKDHVSAGEMKLLDPEDFGDLHSRDHTQCDILVEFFDLSIVLEEVLCVFQPYYTPFTTEEKDEIVDSLYVWLSTHADSLLDEHYHHDTNRIAAATLARINHSKTDTASEGASAKSTNFSVPFQQFRTWFLSASAAVSRYRETAEEGGV